MRFFYIYKMYTDLTNEIRAIFIGTLLTFEDKSFLFDIFKEKIKGVSISKL